MYKAPLMSFDDALLTLIAFAGNFSAPKSAWYAGTTNDPENLLFEEHNVDRNANTHMVVQCQSKEEAEQLEDYLFNVYGCTGELGGGNEDSVYVYVYLMSESTVQ